MRNLSEDYVNGSKAAARDVFVKIMLNDEEDTVFDTESLLPISANRSITDGSFGVGFSSSDRLTFSVAADDKVPKKTRATVYAAFSTNGTYERLGRFYCEESRRNGNIISVTAFDAMNILRTRTVKFTGISSKDIPELTFPCSMQSVLDYIVAKNGLTCEFVCEDFTVQEKPMRNETEYYSDAEILGFIASSHARNAKFDYEGKLAFVGYTAVDSAFTASNVIDMSLDDSEPFEVTGLLFKIGDDTIYIDDVEGSEYDEEAEGVLKIENPFASVEIAEYVWSQLGGLKYYGGSITIRGAGILECGDVITVKNLKKPSDTTEYPFCITSIDYSIGNEGFIEVLSSKVTKSGGTSLSAGGSSSSGGKTYYAGQGLTLTDDNAFKLNIANRNDIGGIRIDAGKQVEEGYEGADLGIYKGADAFPTLRTALRYQKGGFFLGDGFVPLLEEYEEDGETKYKVTDYVQLRLGDGLEFTDNDEETTDIFEKRENSLGGRRVSAAKATAETFGVVRPGIGLMIDNNGLLRTIYSAGNGIDISELGEIGVRYDNDTIRLNGDGQLEANGVTIENAVVIQEADAKYLLHNYTEVEYIAGNRIGYAGVGNQIIVQGYTAYNSGNVTTGGTNTIPSQYQYFTDFVFERPVFLSYSSSYKYSISRIYLRFKQATTTYNRYELVYVTTDGTELIASNIDAYFNYVESTARIMLTWTAVHPPGYTTKYGQVCEFGCAHCTPVIVHSQNSATEHYQVSTLGNSNYLPYVQFVSEAEYNAAVGLTYEPNALIQVQETVTEV